MKRTAILAAVLLMLSPRLGLAAGTPRVFLFEPSVVEALRQRVAIGKPSDPALNRLRAEADRALKLPVLSVTDKQVLPPSGDKHDYMSLAPYWWPNPQTPNGLPYIRRDGERNPEVNKIRDHRELDDLISAVHRLGLAYYIFGDDVYAAKATALLRAWFIEPQTRMNPNLTYAQAVPGRNQGRGTGLIETRDIVKLIDGVGLLAGSHSWTANDQKSLESWCAKFLDWMRHSANGKDEARAQNNHGSFYDVQVASLALFTGDTAFAEGVLREACHRRILKQIDRDGRQPLELERTKSMSYSAFNLEALFELGALGERVSLDLWNCQAKDGPAIRKALDFLEPFASGDRNWIYKQIEPVNRREIAVRFALAATKYRNPAYRDAARRIDPEVVEELEYLIGSPELQPGHGEDVK
jgi:hypothetical protein